MSINFRELDKKVRQKYMNKLRNILKKNMEIIVRCKRNEIIFNDIIFS